VGTQRGREATNRLGLEPQENAGVLSAKTLEENPDDYCRLQGKQDPIATQSRRERGGHFKADPDEEDKSGGQCAIEASPKTVTRVSRRRIFSCWGLRAGKKIS